MRRKRLTPAQTRVLENARDGKSLDDGFPGRSAHGGLARTIFSLRKQKLLNSDKADWAYSYITEAGRAALAAGSYPIEETS